MINSNVELLLKGHGLDDSSIKIIKDILVNKKTTNERVQKLCRVSKATASRYLEKLEGKYIERIGETGRGTFYLIKDSLKEIEE